MFIYFLRLKILNLGIKGLRINLNIALKPPHKEQGGGRKRL
jgi:hypothetical protein